MDNNKLNKKLYRISGKFKSSDKVVAFLYELMRDELTPGQVEKLIRNSEDSGETYYTNGYLAKYADYLAKRLK